jgi:hypothetical protein
LLWNKPYISWHGTLLPLCCYRAPWSHLPPSPFISSLRHDTGGGEREKRLCLRAHPSQCCATRAILHINGVIAPSSRLGPRCASNKDFGKYVFNDHSIHASLNASQSYFCKMRIARGLLAGMICKLCYQRNKGAYMVCGEWCRYVSHPCPLAALLASSKSVYIIL